MISEPTHFLSQVSGTFPQKGVVPGPPNCKMVNRMLIAINAMSILITIIGPKESFSMDTKEESCTFNHVSKRVCLDLLDERLNSVLILGFITFQLFSAWALCSGLCLFESQRMNFTYRFRCAVEFYDRRYCFS